MRQDFLFPKIDLPDLIYTDEVLENLIDYLPEDKLKAYLEKEKVKIRDDKMWKFGNENFFNEDGTKWEMSSGELAIFKAITLKRDPQVIIVSSTQYGKCGQFDIVLASGEIKKIKDIKVGDIVLSVDNYKIVKNKVKGKVSNGIKEVFELKTASGRKVKTTIIHPFLTSEGWKELKDIKKGELIATPRIIPVNGIKKFDEKKIKLLGYLLGDGGISIKNQISFTNNDLEIIKEFESCLSNELYLRPKQVKGNFNVCLKEKDKTKQKNTHSLNKWVKEIGLSGKNSHTKFIPNFVFELKNKYIALLINRMWACDGWASVNNQQGCEIGYCSVSEQMIYQLQHLLLRFGILSRVYKKNVKYKSERRKAYQLVIQGKENHLKFAFKIGIFSKEKQLQKLVNLQLQKKEVRQQYDVIPKKLFNTLNGVRVNWASRNVGRENAKLINEKIGNSDIYWDKVKSIKKLYKDEVWDIEVENSHNFIANDIFAHNTLTVSRGVLARITAFPEDYLVTVPDLKRGKIFLTYMMYDTANNDYFKSKLFGIPAKEKSKLERLLEERSKIRLTYQVIGEDNRIRYGSVQLLSVQARIKQNAITAIMGFGGANVINDESALVDDEVDAGVFRMLAGQKGDTFIMKIGNPFFRNHFLTDWKKEKWKKIHINYKIGLLEGRYRPEIIEEALLKPRAEVLWDSRFPREGAADRENWIPLLTENEIQLAIQGGVHFGEEKIGVDPASSGSNEAVIVNRSRGYAEVLLATGKIDPMDFTGQVFIKTQDTNARKIMIDKIGEGSGVYSRIDEVNRIDKKRKYQVFGVCSQERAIDTKTYFNRRAEMFMRVRQWIKSGGKLSKDERWFQLTRVKYKQADSSGKIKIQSKDEMKSKTGDDELGAADALALTFHASDKMPTISVEDRFFYQRMREKEAKKTSGGYRLKMA